MGFYQESSEEVGPIDISDFTIVPGDDNPPYPAIEIDDASAHTVMQLVKDRSA